MHYNPELLRPFQSLGMLETACNLAHYSLVIFLFAVPPQLTFIPQHVQTWRVTYGLYIWCVCE